MDTNSELKRCLARGKVNSFVGAGMFAGAGLPGWYTLIAELASRVGYELPPRQWATGDALIDAAQAYVNQQGLYSRSPTSRSAWTRPASSPQRRTA